MEFSYVHGRWIFASRQQRHEAFSYKLKLRALARLATDCPGPRLYTEANGIPTQNIPSLASMLASEKEHSTLQYQPSRSVGRDSGTRDHTNTSMVKVASHVDSVGRHPRWMSTHGVSGCLPWYDPVQGLGHSMTPEVMAQPHACSRAHRSAASIASSAASTEWPKAAEPGRDCHTT